MTIDFQVTPQPWFRYTPERPPHVGDGVRYVGGDLSFKNVYGRVVGVEADFVRMVSEFESAYLRLPWQCPASDLEFDASREPSAGDVEAERKPEWRPYSGDRRPLLNDSVRLRPGAEKVNHSSGGRVVFAPLESVVCTVCWGGRRHLFEWEAVADLEYEVTPSESVRSPAGSFEDVPPPLPDDLVEAIRRKTTEALEAFSAPASLSWARPGVRMDSATIYDASNPDAPPVEVDLSPLMPAARRLKLAKACFIAWRDAVTAANDRENMVTDPNVTVPFAELSPADRDAFVAAAMAVLDAATDSDDDGHVDCEACDKRVPRAEAALDEVDAVYLCKACTQALVDEAAQRGITVIQTTTSENGAES